MALLRPSNEVTGAVKACRRYFMFAGLFSAGVNILYLTPSLYMLQVYDRVVRASSVETLIFLTIATLLAMAVLGALDDVRAHVLVRAGIRIDRLLASRVLAALTENRTTPGSRRYIEGMRDLDTFRQTMTSTGIHAVFDAPWMPLYIVLLFLVHPWMGVLAIVSAIILMSFALITELATKPGLTRANNAAMLSYGATESALRNAEVVQAMGMQSGMARKLLAQRSIMLGFQALASDRAAHIGALTKAFRMFLQSAMLGLGGYLAIENEISAGMMVAGGIIMGRALVPVEIMVGGWKQMVAGRDAFNRLRMLLAERPARPVGMALPRPAGALTAERVLFSAPGSNRPIIKGINFAVPAGSALGIVGPSGAGKSCLARLILGIWRPTAGTVRLDGADVATWNREDLGRHVGYLPQDIELFAGTIRENIARFTDGSPEDVIKAAQRAGVHEMILGLPNGYDSTIGDSASVVLSGGQRQRLALARALFGEPRFLVLDEPNSNLDSDGEQALVKAMTELKAQGSTIIIIAHRPAVLTMVDRIMVLRDGLIEAFGPRNEVLAKLAPTVVRPAAFMRGSGAEGGAPGGEG